MIAPSSPGSYVTKWRLFAPDGIHWFGPEFTFTIDVATGIEGVVPAGRKFSHRLVVRHSRPDRHRHRADPRRRLCGADVQSQVALARHCFCGGYATLGLALSRESIAVRHGDYEGKPTDDHEVLLKIGGPGVLSIKDHTAVLTERGARYSRVLGPEDHTLMPFERIRAIYDLRTQSL